MGCASSVPSKNHVVIVGAGYAGTEVALKLESMGLKVNAGCGAACCPPCVVGSPCPCCRGSQVTLIERKAFFYHSIGALRGMVDESFAPRVLVPQDKVMVKGSIVQVCCCALSHVKLA
jgi:hypothetical protein